MKSITSVVVAAALAAGMTVASAQTQQPPVAGGGGQKEGVAPQEMQRPQANPAPTTGAGGMTAPTQGRAGEPRKQDEQAGGTNQAVERNPDGSTGGSKSAPSR